MTFDLPVFCLLSTEDGLTTRKSFTDVCSVLGQQCGRSHSDSTRPSLPYSNFPFCILSFPPQRRQAPAGTALDKAQQAKAVDAKLQILAILKYYMDLRLDVRLSRVLSMFKKSIIEPLAQASPTDLPRTSLVE